MGTCEVVPQPFISLRGKRGGSRGKRRYVCRYVQLVGSQVVGLCKGDSPARGFGAAVAPGAAEVDRARSCKGSTKGQNGK